MNPVILNDVIVPDLDVLRRRFPPRRPPVFRPPAHPLFGGFSGEVRDNGCAVGWKTGGRVGGKRMVGRAENPREYARHLQMS